MREIRLNWKTIDRLFVKLLMTDTKADNIDSRPPTDLTKILNKFSALFKDELGLFNGGKAKLHLKPEARPKYFKARPVAYTKKPRIEAELNRMLRLCIREQVNFLD